MHGPGHHHHHHPDVAELASDDVNRRALTMSLYVQITFLIVQIIGGIAFGSLALLSDSLHMVTDVAAIIVALVAARAVTRASVKHTYGLGRAETVAAFVNSLTLIGAGVWIVWEGMTRLGSDHVVEGAGVVAVATLGLLANVVTAMILMRANRDNSNIRAVLAHTIVDAVSSVGVIIAGIIVAVTGLAAVDVLASFLIAGLAIYSALPIFRTTLSLLLDTAPEGADPATVQVALAAHPGVCDVHDVHVWRRTDTETYLTAHVRYLDSIDPVPLQQELAAIIDSRFAIHHVTLQMLPDRSTARPIGGLVPADVAIPAVVERIRLEPGLDPGIDVEATVRACAGPHRAMVSPLGLYVRARKAVGLQPAIQSNEHDHEHDHGHGHNHHHDH